MKNTIQTLAVALAVAAILGCSGGKSSPVLPEPASITPQNIETSAGHVLWGLWECFINPSTLEVSVEPIRDVQNHFNVTGFVLPPSCTNCISMEVLDVNIPSSTFSVKVKLRNPTAVTGYDIRGIIYLKSQQVLLSADNWTNLFDLPGDYERNPFMAFAKEAPNRQFAGNESYAAVYRLVLPPGQTAVKFAVDASAPTNCPEPYAVDIIKGIDFLGDNATYTDGIEAAIYDWQNDIAAVELDLSSMGATSPVSLTLQGNVWKASVSNAYGASPGFYKCWLQARSPVGPSIYQPLQIEVKAFGADRLPTLLSTMHTWDPQDPLSKSNMKYEGDDLQWIDFVADTPYGSARLPYYDGIHREPLKTVGYCSNVLDNLGAQTDPPILYNMLTIGTQQLGETFTPTSFMYTPTASPIADAMEAMYSAIGSSLSSDDKNTIATQTSSLPTAIQNLVAAMLRSVGEGYDFRQSALSGYASDEKTALFDNGKAALDDGMLYYFIMEASINFPYQDMYNAAGPITQALDQMRQTGLNYTGGTVAGWEWDTPIGKVQIGTDGNDTFTGDSFLLLLDPGGSDTYNCPAGANSSLDNPFSICIDLGGDDIYSDQGTGKFAQGAGRCGIGVLWDCNGDDQYTSWRECQGMGNFGVGFLIDSGGHDIYTADAISQGAGFYGIGVLVDEWGNDQYNCYLFSQGFGYTKGWGIACDNEGNDKWVANDTNIIYPSLQTDQHNISMSQGMGYGLRYDGSNPPTDSFWISGGQGVLIDRSGDDTYSCGVFGQACAYWFGTGILADYGGTDNMRGIWYVQSGDAHYGTCFLIAQGSDNDTYSVSHNVGMGGGHDLSNAFFLEEGGDDNYTNIPDLDPSAWPGISLGAGNDCGTGVFVDYGGNDTYGNPNANTIGHGNFLDFRNRGSWGVFLDLGGTDSYTYEKQLQGVGDGNAWNIGDIGAGGDFPNGVVLWQ